MNGFSIAIFCTHGLINSKFRFIDSYHRHRMYVMEFKLPSINGDRRDNQHRVDHIGGQITFIYRKVFLVRPPLAHNIFLFIVIILITRNIFSSGIHRKSAFYTSRGSHRCICFCCYWVTPSEGRLLWMLFL